MAKLDFFKYETVTKRVRLDISIEYENAICLVIKDGQRLVGVSNSMCYAVFVKKDSGFFINEKFFFSSDTKNGNYVSFKSIVVDNLEENIIHNLKKEGSSFLPLKDFAQEFVNAVDNYIVANNEFAEKFRLFLQTAK